MLDKDNILKIGRRKITYSNLRRHISNAKSCCIVFHAVPSQKFYMVNLKYIIIAVQSVYLIDKVVNIDRLKMLNHVEIPIGGIVMAVPLTY